MTIKRRNFLRTLGAGSLLLTTAGRTLAKTSETSWSAQGNLLPPVIHLQTGSLTNEAFSRGIASARASGKATGEIKTLSLNAARIYDSVFVHQLIGDLRGHRVIGTMDDAGFTIFHAIARSLGSRILCSGQHSWGGKGDFHSHHQIASVAEYQGIGGALADRLADSGQGYFINERCLGVPAITREQGQKSLTRGGDWTAALAEALTLIGLDKWTPGKVGRFESASPVSAGCSRQVFASFAIEL